MYFQTSYKVSIDRFGRFICIQVLWRSRTEHLVADLCFQLVGMYVLSASFTSISWRFISPLISYFSLLVCRLRAFLKWWWININTVWHCRNHFFIHLHRCVDLVNYGYIFLAGFWITCKLWIFQITRLPVIMDLCAIRIDSTSYPDAVFFGEDFVCLGLFFGFLFPVFDFNCYSF